MADPTTEAYDKIAEEYERTNANSIWTVHLQEFKELVSGKRILEIGCGSGRDAPNFVDTDYEYVGIDASENLLRIAQKRLPNHDFRLMDFYNLQFESHFFDGFLAIASLLHIPKNKIGEVLKSIEGIVKPEGAGFIAMRKGDGEGWRKKNGNRRYFSFYNADEFEQILEQSNYSVLKIGEAKEPNGTEWLYFFAKTKNRQS